MPQNFLKVTSSHRTKQVLLRYAHKIISSLKLHRLPFFALFCTFLTMLSLMSLNLGLPRRGSNNTEPTDIPGTLWGGCVLNRTLTMTTAKDREYPWNIDVRSTQRITRAIPATSLSGFFVELTQWEGLLGSPM